MSNDYTRPPFSDLTREEMESLELRYNGPIPEQAALDKIATRPVRDAAFLHSKIEEALSGIRWYRTELLGYEKANDSWMAGITSNIIDREERKLAALRAELAELSPIKLAAAE